MKRKHWKLLAVCVVLLLLWYRFGPNDAEKVIKNTIGTDADLILLKEEILEKDIRVSYVNKRILCLATDEDSPSFYVVDLTEFPYHRFECRNYRLFEWHPNIYFGPGSLSSQYFVINDPNIAYLGLLIDGENHHIEVDQIPFVYFWHRDEGSSSLPGRCLYTKTGEILE